MASAFTLIDDGSCLEVDAAVSDGRVSLSAEALESALGWTLESEGLCRGSVCVSVRDRGVLERDGRIDLAGFAEALGRPLAIDIDERAAALGASAIDRSARLESLEAPDFTLSDLEGREHTLSSHRGKKVLLIVYSSW
jgi:hypothetical protein